MAVQAVSEFYAAQQRRIVAALTATRAEWSKLSKPGDFDQIARRLYAILLSAQIGAARDAAAMVPAALAEDGDYPLQVNPAAFAGGATLMRDPAVQMPLGAMLWLTPDAAQGHGGSLADQMAYGGRVLDLMTQMQIADAGRAATGAGIGMRVKVGYYRHVNPPCCADCALQAGKFFRYNAGFARHPHCDCIHVPAYVDRAPEGYTDQPPLDQITGLSEAERKAVEDGGSLSMVVNARRGAYKMFTTEGVTRRGYYSYLRRAMDSEWGRTTEEWAVNVGRRGYVKNYVERRIKMRRLSPEGIYKIARNQEQAVLLLIKNGYVVGDISKLAKLAVAQMRLLTP